MTRCTLLVAAAMVAASPVLAQERPDYSSFREGRFLRYLNAEPSGIGRVPRIGLSFGGEPIRAVIDSGSTGIVVAALYIPGFDQLAVVGDGRLTYSSSGRVMIGKWVLTPVTLVGQEGGSVQTEPMPVLAVTEVRCLDDARDCTPREDPSGIAMVGVGFGREGDMQSQSTPDKNPLLRVTAGDGPRRRGYILTREGVHIGLTESNTGGAFRFVQLKRQPDRPDWAGTPACISLNGQSPPACGSMLVDTGVGVMYMTVPPSQTGAAEDVLPPGTQVSIRAGGTDGFDLYGFSVDDGSPMAPAMVHLRESQTARPFVNTSFHLLNGFDFLYDADGGYVGFRQR